VVLGTRFSIIKINLCEYLKGFQKLFAKIQLPVAQKQLNLLLTKFYNSIIFDHIWGVVKEYKN